LSKDSNWTKRPLVLSVTVPGAKDKIRLALPRGPQGPGSITAICGINASGKTYILKGVGSAIMNAAAGAQDHPHTQVTLSQPELPTAPPKMLLFTNTPQNKEKTGHVDLAMTQAKFKLPGDMVNYRLPMLEFFRRELIRRFSKDEISWEDWLHQREQREVLANRIPPENVALSADAHDPFVAALERVLGAQLYYRRRLKAQLELIKRDVSGNLKVYSRWSDGEKVVFHIAGMVLLEKPDIVLLDEIENHLHPSLISALLEMLRSHVPQTLIATHHPHVIFSEWIDQVYYMDTRWEPREIGRPDKLSYDKAQHAAPPREVYALVDDFDRLASTYALFSKQDRKLLEQAALVNSAAVVEAGELLRQIFSSAEPIGASPKTIPDRQTRLVLDWLRQYTPNDAPAAVLDLGAGLGRVVLESSKLGPWSPPQEIVWTCWEPLPQTRTRLRAAMADYEHVRVIEGIDEVAPGQCSIALIANVLHELTPPMAAELLTVAFERVLAHDGTLLILELYPLVTPEKFAVPYPSYVLRRILRSVQITCFEHDFSVLGCRGYLLACTWSGGSFDFRAQIRGSIETGWDELLDDAVQQYKALANIRGVETYRHFVSQVTTIASIVAWQRGAWKQS
jgi:energy-coupling factor transporter ATP-binding protein EcfA2